MDAAPPVATYRLAGLVLDIRRGSLLTAAGEQLSLRRQSFELLRLLVENAGQLLDRDTINRAIWSDVVVTDDSMTQCVRDIRRAIGDDVQQILKTVRKRGYLLAAEVVMACDPQTGPLSQGLALPDKSSLVVLPFQNMSSDPEQEYFTDGMVDDITTGLSRIRSLFVISRNSAFTYRGSAVDVRQVGRELGVRYVLEGSVRKAGKRVRVTGQLVEAATGGHIWADRFDGNLEDVFKLQDQVTESVVAAIEPNLLAAEIERARRKPVENLQAYDLMLRALPRLWTQMRDGFEDAFRLLRGAFEIDPAYALVAAYLAWGQWNAVSQNWVDRSDPAVADMVQLAQTALELAPEDPEVLTLAGGVIALPGGDLSRGIALSEKAISLNPNNAQALRQLGQLYGYAGDKQSAISCLDRAFRLNPVSETAIFHTGYVLAHFVAGEHEAAVEWSAKALRHRPNSAAVMRYRAASLGLLGRLEEGRETVRRLLELVPNFNVTRARRHIEFDMNNVFRTPGLADSFYEGLRRSGVPE